MALTAKTKKLSSVNILPLLGVAALIIGVVSYAFHIQNQATHAAPGDPTPVEHFAYTVEADGVVIDEYLADGPADVVIPGEIEGRPVIEIRSDAFSGWSTPTITSLLLPSTIQTIGQFAFAYNELNTLVIPDSVTSVGADAFMGNPLESVTLGNGLEEIPDAMFAYNQLTHVDIPNSVNSIGDGAFKGNGLVSVDIPGSVETIGRGAFAENVSLETVIVRDGVRIIEEGAFTNTYNLRSVTLPDSLTEIQSAFKGAGSIEPMAVVIGTSSFAGEAHTVLRNGAFHGSKIRQLTLGNAIKEIGEGAFAEAGIEELNLGKSVELIMNGAFGRNNIVELVVPGSLKFIGSGVPDLPFSPNGGVFAFNRLESVVVEEGVEVINPGTFDYNPTVKTVVLPNSLTDVYSAFNHDSPISELTIGTSSYDGPAQTVVHEGAFGVETPVDTVVLGSSVKEIGRGAFAGTFAGAGIKEIEIREGVEVIREAAFAENSLRSITIPASVQSVENGAFRDNSLEAVYLKGNPQIGEGVFTYNGLDKSEVPAGLSPSDKNIYYQDNAELVRIYTDGPVSYESEYFYTENRGGPSRWTGPIVSGTIVNPSHFTVAYRTTDGADLAPQTMNIISDTLTDYKLINTIDDTTSETPTLSFDEYYLAGDTVNPSLLTFPDYITPPAQSIVLGRVFGENAQSNDVVYIYQTTQDGDDDDDDSDTPNPDGESDDVPVEPEEGTDEGEGALAPPKSGVARTPSALLFGLMATLLLGGFVVARKTKYTK